MKRFSFGVDEKLHERLRANARAAGLSMAALCREALASHLDRLERETVFFKTPFGTVRFETTEQSREARKRPLLEEARRSCSSYDERLLDEIWA